MHEYGLCVNIINIVCERAEGRGVAAIDLTVGDLSGCVADSVAMYFDILAEGTVCEKAALRVERIKPKLKCAACGALFERKPFEFQCPCGGTGEPTEIGREFYVKSIEFTEVCDGRGYRGNGVGIQAERNIG